MKQHSSLLSLAAAAGAGALVMYFLDAKNGVRGHGPMRRQAASSSVGRGSWHRTERSAAQPTAPHPTAAAQDSWTEQGV